MPDPRPFVVGMDWVTACAEQNTHVDEVAFLVEPTTQVRKRPSVREEPHFLYNPLVFIGFSALGREVSEKD